MSRAVRSDRNEMLKRAFRLLRYLGEHRFGVTFAEMIRDCEMPRRQIYRYLRTFKEVGIRIHKVRIVGRKGHEGRWKLVNPREHLELAAIL